MNDIIYTIFLDNKITCILHYVGSDEHFRTKAPTPAERQKPSWSPLFGILALLVVAVAIWQSWGLYVTWRMIGLLERHF